MIGFVTKLEPRLQAPMELVEWVLPDRAGPASRLAAMGMVGPCALLQWVSHTGRLRTMLKPCALWYPMPSQ